MAAAVQDAGARTEAVDEREASWSAPALWRFVKHKNQRERELTNDKIYERKIEKHLEKIINRLARSFAGVADSDGRLGNHLVDLVNCHENTRGQVG
jgi:protein involved in temperature-dependent protein secretion